MNRIITINIGGLAIQIEEDAYEVLKKYLNKIDQHFANTQNGSEIIEDIEARVAEMLHEKLENKPSINVQDVEDVIAVMGNPTDFDAEEEEETSSSSSQSSTRGRKSLFRDPEKGIIGGVCSGLSHYLGIDVVIIRAIWLISFFFFGTGFLVYLILWFIIPEADSTADRIKMMGETPNVNNIKNTIREEADKAINNIKNAGASEKVKGFFERVGDFFLSILGGLGRFIFAILSIIVFCIFIAVVAHLLTGHSAFHVDVPWMNREQLSQVYNNGFMFWVTLSSFYLLILIPLARILIGMVQFTFTGGKKMAQHRPVRTGLRYLFLFSLVVLILSSVYTYSLFANSHQTNDEQILKVQSDTLYLNRMEDVPNDAMEIREDVKLYIHYNHDDAYELQMDKSSKGRNEDEAADLITEIRDGHELRESSLYFSRRVLLDEGSSYRQQELRYDLYVPDGTVLVLGERIYPILRGAKSVEKIPTYKMRGNTFRMTPGGLTCLTCSESSKKRYSQSSIHEDFDKISINEWVKATIIQGDENSVHMEGDKTELKEITARVKNGKLKIYSTDDDYVWNRFRDNVEIIITCKDLNYLESNGASNIRIEGFKDLDRIKIELNGATELKAVDLESENLDLEVNGAAKVHLSGAGDNLELETNGASTINTYKYDVANVDLQISGAASCFVYASKTINGNAAGVSKIRYKGDASTDVDIDGFASMKRAD